VSDTAEEQRAGSTGEILKRDGTARESARRLARKAEEAERSSIGIHGVSVTAGFPRHPPASEAPRHEVEKHFRVHDTPTRADPLHRTVELPKPMTQEVADLFNRLFGRS
jgi:LDH2 family malate/lactate/ureidoglycolate dehydrogenase